MTETLNRATPELNRFRSLIRVENDCHVWTGTLMWKGYGIFHIGGKSIRAHKLAYELSRGPVPEGMVIDHLCRNRACVNPDHLDAVTPAENLRRSTVAPATINTQKTHCPKGHSYSGNNLLIRKDGSRECRECSRIEGRRYFAANRDAVNAKKRMRRAAKMEVACA